MLCNLRAEMQRSNLSARDIARVIDKTERSARDKITGRAVFTLPEALKVRDTYFAGMPLEYLFAGVSRAV